MGTPHMLWNNNNINQCQKKIGSKDIELGSLDSDIEIERWKWREGETVT